MTRNPLTLAPNPDTSQEEGWITLGVAAGTLATLFCILPTCAAFLYCCYRSCQAHGGVKGLFRNVVTCFFGNVSNRVNVDDGDAELRVTPPEPQ